MTVRPIVAITLLILVGCAAAQSQYGDAIAGLQAKIAENAEAIANVELDVDMDAVVEAAVAKVETKVESSVGRDLKIFDFSQINGSATGVGGTLGFGILALGGWKVRNWKRDSKKLRDVDAALWTCVKAIESHAMRHEDHKGRHGIKDAVAEQSKADKTEWVIAERAAAMKVRKG